MAAVSSLRLSLPIAPLGAITAATIVVAVGWSLPEDLAERLELASGLTPLLDHAESSGISVRLLVAGLTGLVIMAAGWATLFLLIGRRRVVVRLRSRAPHGPLAIRRADRHPDAPPRRPVLATQELGAPFLAVCANEGDAAPATTIPRDLDLLLAAFDPASIPEASREPVRAVPSLIRPAALAAGERIVTFAPGANPITEPASIEAILRRIEEIGRRRPQRPPATPNPNHSLEETLASLRRSTGRA